MQAQGSGDFKLSQQGDDPADNEVMRSGDKAEAGLTGGSGGTKAERQPKAAAAAEERFTQGLSPQYYVSGGQAEYNPQAAAAEKPGFSQGSHQSVATSPGLHHAASNWSTVPVPKAGIAEGLKQGSQQLAGSQEAGQAPRVTPAEEMAASRVEHSHIAHSQGSHLHTSHPYTQTATTADAGEKKEDSMRKHKASAVTELLNQTSGKGAADERELPVVKKLPPWFKDSSEHAEEVHSPACPVHKCLQP